MQELLTQIQDMQGRVIKLQDRAHKLGSASVKTPEKLEKYIIGKGQDPARVLKGNELAEYQATLDWLTDMKSDVWNILSGKQAEKKGFTAQIHSKSFRGIENYTVVLEILVFKYRDAAALAELAEIGLAIPAMAVDRYQPMPVLKDGKLLTPQAAGVEETFGPQALKEKARNLEQIGLKRFCNLWGDDGKPDNDVGTDTDELELDLYFETIAELLHVLTVNKSFSPRVDEAAKELGKLYWDNLRPRREYLSSKLFPGKPKDVYGKDLLHPTVNKYLEHEHAFAMRGLPEDRAAADRIKGYLDVHFEYLQASDGTETVIGAHRVIGRAKEMRITFGVTGLHNTGYLREWLPNVLVGNWLNFELCSDRFVNALAQTIYWHVMIDGVEGSLAPNMGGGRTDTDKRFDMARFRGGKTAAITKAKNWGDGSDKQGLHAISGSNLPTLAHLTGREDLRRELEALDKTSDSKKYGRHGVRLGLLLWETAKREGRI